MRNNFYRFLLMLRQSLDQYPFTLLLAPSSHTAWRVQPARCVFVDTSAASRRLARHPIGPRTYFFRTKLARSTPARPISPSTGHLDPHAIRSLPMPAARAAGGKAKSRPDSSRSASDLPAGGQRVENTWADR